MSQGPPDRPRLVARLHTMHPTQDAAVLAWLGFRADQDNPADRSVGHDGIELVPEHSWMPRIELVLEVLDLDATHRRLQGSIPDRERGLAPIHVGLLGPSGDGTDRRQFVVHLGRDEFLTIRECPSAPARNAGGVASEPADGPIPAESAAIEASVRIPAGADAGMGGPAIWAKAELFRRRTGAPMASAASAAPRQSPWDRPRFVTGGRRGTDPYEVELGEWVWEGQGTRDLEILPTHAPGVERSRFALQTTRVGAEDVVQMRHDGWTESNRVHRVEFLDWQDRLDSWAAGLRPPVKDDEKSYMCGQPASLRAPRAT